MLCKKKGRTLVCLLDGDFDLTVAKEFKNEVQGWFDKHETLLNLVIDLTGVGFVDSSGLGAILGRYKQVTALGGKVAVVGLAPSVRRVFELSGVLKLVGVAETLDGALAAV